MSAVNSPDRQRRRGIMDRIVALSPKAPPNTWWAVAVFVAVVAFRHLVLPAGMVGTFLQFLIAGGIAATWFFLSWRGWLSMAVVATVFFIVLLPFGIVNLFLLMATGIAAWMLDGSLTEARKREQVPARDIPGPTLPSYGVPGSGAQGDADPAAGAEPRYQQPPGNATKRYEG